MSEEFKQKFRASVVDKTLEKMVSRKLLVWAIATAGVPLGFLDGDQWVQLSMIYIGSQAAMDFALQYTRAKKEQAA
jgi:hypothetical protein